MIWQKDSLKATQPFYVLNTDKFLQEIYFRQGISHFYSFRTAKRMTISTVPDGCIDLLFVYYGAGMKSYVCGSVLKCSQVEWEGPAEFFGVRFLPGFHPAGLLVTQRDLLESRFPLERYLQKQELIRLLAPQTDFCQRIRTFLREYTKMEEKREAPYGKKELVASVKSLVYQSGGLIRIGEIENRTGYTARYINKVFLEEMGFGPKTFCKIIQFQRALEYLNYGVPANMTDAAVALGYYDQPQFIRDFKEYAGMTPAKYLRLVHDQTYQARVRDMGFFLDSAACEGK